MTGSPGTLQVSGDPNGHQAVAASFTRAALVDNTSTAPGARGRGLPAILDPVADPARDLPAGSGNGTVAFSPADTSPALGPSIADPAPAIDALRQ